MATTNRKTVPSLPYVGKKGVQARVGHADVPYRMWASLPARDEGDDWITQRCDVGQNKRGEQVYPMQPTFHRSTRRNVGRIAVLGRYRQMVRTQTGSANKERPYRHGQELELTITQDSGWQKRYPRIPAEKRTPTEQKWAAARAAAVILVAGTVVAGVAIGGNGNRMSNDERTSQAKNKVIETVQGMTGAEQYATLYINGGPENKVASFDDSSGQNVFNTGLSRLAAEYSDAHVYMGDNCLANSAYNTRGRQPAAYKETLDGQVAIVSQGRSRLHFELEGGVLQPRDDSTIATLTSLNCDATGIPAGLTNESSFVVGFAEAAQ